MSTTIMSACWPLQGMTIAQKAVLVSLADNANDQGVCWPSIPTIAKRVCASERAVQNAIKWLEKVKLVRANRQNGRHTSYTITPAAYAPPQDIHPRTAFTPAGNAPAQEIHHTPAGDAGDPRSICTTPPQHMPSNRKEPSLNHQETQTERLAPPVSVENKTDGKAKGKSVERDTLTANDLVAEGVDRQHAKDWLTVRRKKSAPLTPTAWGDVKSEAAKAGMTPAQAVEHVAKTGWAGFRASWLAEGKQAMAAASSDPEWDRSMEGIKRRGAELGVKDLQAGEQWMVYKARVLKAAGAGPWIDRMLKEFQGTESVHQQLTAYFNDVRADAATA